MLAWFVPPVVVPALLMVAIAVTVCCDESR